MARCLPPNILWICTDSQRWDTLGCYGNPFVHTPHLDRLAAGGVLCERVFAQSPLCTPSRGCFLTGRYPVTNRLRQNGQDAPPDLRLVTRGLAAAGYSCGLAGKLHLSACEQRFVAGADGQPPPRDRWLRAYEPRIDDGYAVFHWDHAPNGRHAGSDYTAWLRAEGVDLCAAPRADSRHVDHGQPSSHHQTKWCVDRAIEFFEPRASSGMPWLFSVNIFDPHFPFNPPDDALERYLERLDEIPLSTHINANVDALPAAVRAAVQKPKGRWNFRDMTARDHRLVRAAYWAMCDHIDAQVGRLLDALSRTGQRETTLVIFTSDHGEMLGDHGVYTKGPLLYDPAIRVPLIFSWPGRLPAGKRVSALVELADLAPTLLDAAGLPRDPGMQARSLWPLLVSSAPADHFRDDVYCEYYNANPDEVPAYLTLVRTEKHKLVRAHGTGEGELYDLAADPDEQTNLWRSPAHAPLKAEMLDRLTDRMAWTCDPLPERVGIF